MGKYAKKVFKNCQKFWISQKNCQKLGTLLKIVKKHPIFLNISVKFSFLNRTLGLRKSLIIQTTYVLKIWLFQQFSLNRDFFLNHSFFNRDSSVLCIPKIG